MIEQLLECGSGIGIDEFTEVVIEWDCLESDDGVVGSLALVCELLHCPLELPPDDAHTLPRREMLRNRLAVRQQQSHPHSIFSEIIVLGGLKLLLDLASTLPLTHAYPFSIEALLIGRGDIAKHD